jgi:nitrogen fixation protein NifU and related proteins
MTATALQTTTATAAENELYQDLVVEHKRAPRHYGHLGAPTHQARGHNPQCGDDLQVELVMVGDQVQDIAFHGQGCAICIASASMMSEAAIGRDKAEVQALQQRFRAALTGQLEPEAVQLGKLVSLAGVRRYPGRIKCALLGWHALMHALAAEAYAEPGATP